jgi:cytoskeleton protein RodZ
MDDPLNQSSADPGLPAVPAEPEAAAPGAMLAQRRAACGLALTDVANRLKFAPRQIEALEADDYGKLPGMTCVRGMIRSYAKLLEMDSGPMIKALERRHASPPVSVEMHSEKIPFPDGRARSTRIYLGLSALLVIAVGAVVYEWNFGLPQVLTGSTAPSEISAPAQSEPPASNARQEPAPPVEPGPKALAATPKAEQPASVPAQNPAPAGAGNPVSADAARILLEFQEPSWVQVQDRVGRILISQLNPGGSRRTIEGDPPFVLVIGNASHVRMTYKDEPVDLTPYIKVEVARLTLD